MFRDRLNEYIAQLGCSGRELAQASGLSPATISRYRSGERRPESEAERAKLAAGIARLAAGRGHPELTEQAVAQELERFFAPDGVDAGRLQANLNSLLSALSLTVADLARGTNYDASYLSRIRSGQRRPADGEGFLSAVAAFALRRCDGPAQRRALAELAGAPEGADEEELRACLIRWLGGGHGGEEGGGRGEDGSVSSFLRQVDEFDLDAYIRATRFDQLKVPAAPFQLPLSRTYYGLEQMRAGELDFLKATVLGRSDAPVFLCSDMQMDDLAQDEDFAKKYKLGLALMLKKGLQLSVVHNLDRPFHELMLGLEGWIPLYMTGQISPYYLKGVQNNVYGHLLNVSGSAALSGECIAGAHARGRYELVKGGEALRYYRDRAEDLRKKALPLMEIYREGRQSALTAFLLTDAQAAGPRCRLLPAPPLCTLGEETLRAMLDARALLEDVKRSVLERAAARRERLETILVHSPVADRFPVLTEEEFARTPPPLPFPESDLPYTWEEYSLHLARTEDYARSHGNYSFRSCAAALRNISLTVCTGRWAMVSKGRAPAIHFLIRYPKLRAALEGFLENQ